MSVKPTYPKWIPGAEAARITDPGEAKRALGYVYQEKPPFQYFNWGLYNFSQWILGMQGSFFDIIVGSSAQVTANEATNVLADLTDGNVPAESKVLILDGTHTLLANMALSNVDLVIVSESPAAIVAVSTFQILMTGARQMLNLRVTGAGANDIQLSGAGSYFEGIDVDILFVQVSGGAHARTTGTNGGIIPLVGPDVTNYVKGVTTYVEDDVGAGATSLDVEASHVANSWESVGPTGSGAANIWTALDSMPIGALYAKVKITSIISGSTLSTDYIIEVWARVTGSSTAIVERLLIARSQFTNGSAAGTTGKSSDVNSENIPLDANGRFDLRYAVAGGASISTSISAYLSGFGI